MAQLVFRRGGDPVFRVALPTSSTKIGRAAHCDVVLNDPEISREHAVLYKIEGRHHLKKLGQSSVLVQGRDVDSYTLKEGDEIGLGPWQALYSEQTPLEDTSDAETVVTNAGSGNTQAVAKGPKGLWVKDLRLQIIEPSRAPREVRFSGDSLTVGAAEKNDIILRDTYVSSRHLKLTLRDGNVLAFDLGSTNGSFVNGVKIKEVELEPGQVVKVGQCEIRVTVEERLEKPAAKEVERFCGMV
ncbi:MAG: FHA domain-containing protein, partial [Deltaproteobacteria bacterium]|nr:FHA domain-containing protein [Deltaproteobacteria bacterium]